MPLRAHGWLKANDTALARLQAAKPRVTGIGRAADLVVAIIPAMFAGGFAGLDTLNIMRLATPESAILSAVVFNALIIVALVPLALRGVD